MRALSYSVFSCCRRHGKTKRIISRTLLFSFRRILAVALLLGSSHSSYGQSFNVTAKPAGTILDLSFPAETSAYYIAFSGLDPEIITSAFAIAKGVAPTQQLFKTQHSSRRKSAFSIAFRAHHWQPRKIRTPMASMIPTNWMNLYSMRSTETTRRKTKTTTAIRASMNFVSIACPAMAPSFQEEVLQVSLPTRGPQTGLIRIEGTNHTQSFISTITNPGSYTLGALPIFSNYWIEAYSDVNNNTNRDPQEAGVMHLGDSSPHGTGLRY